MSALPTPLISVDELAQQLDNQQLVLLDASWYLPAMNRNGFEEWQKLRIGNAQHFDFHSKICDLSSEYPHTMPSAEHFTKSVQLLGVNKDSHIVVYDGLGLFASPRVWWMFKAMGHANVSVLDGGLPAWQKAGLPVNTTHPMKATKGDFVAKPINNKFVNAENVMERLNDDGSVIIDVRPEDRFDGSAPEPREGVRSGHIPNSKNLPFSNLLHDGFMKSQSELEVLLSSVATKDKELVVSCGSGVTACHLALAAELCDYPKVSVFDGSWSEWGARHELPITVGNN